MSGAGQSPPKNLSNQVDLDMVSPMAAGWMFNCWLATVHCIFPDSIVPHPTKFSLQIRLTATALWSHDTQKACFIFLISDS